MNFPTIKHIFKIYLGKVNGCSFLIQAAFCRSASCNACKLAQVWLLPKMSAELGLFRKAKEKKYWCCKFSNVLVELFEV